MELLEYYHNQLGNCLRIQNSYYEMHIALDYGIRIMHFSRREQENILYIQPDDVTELINGEWRNRGGHRIWIAPESNLSYCPDNEKIKYESADDAVLLTQKKDEWLNIEKSLKIIFKDETIELTHIAQNLNNDTMCFSVWPITSLIPGGYVLMPFTPKRENIFSPNKTLSLWGDSTLSDEQLIFEEDKIVLHHKMKAEQLKIGAFVKEGIVYYQLKDMTFVKSFCVDINALYPDNGVNCEVYLCKFMIEVESLSPMYKVNPGDKVTHKEFWKIV